MRNTARRGWYWAADYRYAARSQLSGLADQETPPRYAEGRLAPIVLIAGVMESWTLLRPVADRLNEAGHPIHVVPDLAFNLGTIAEAARIVHTLILGRELTERGVDVRLQSRGDTGMIVVLVDPSGERTMFPSRGASALLAPVDDTWLVGIEVLHLTAYSLVGGTTPDLSLIHI